MHDLISAEKFLKDFPTALLQIDPNAAPVFGKMNPVQMAEHMAEYIRMGYGKPEITEVFYKEEAVPKLHDFLRSDRAFKDNTPNPLMSDTPKPAAAATYKDAVADVAAAADELFAAFASRPDMIVRSPFFGPLDKELTLLLLAKHGAHHLRQFGI